MQQLRDKEKLAKWRVEYVQTIRGRALKLINNARSRAVDKNIEIDLPLDWLEQKLVQNKCEITGLPFDLSKPTEHTRRYNAPSLDRIDKTKGYFVDNTRMVLWLVNCALSEYGTELVLPILKEMVKGIESAKEKQFTPLPDPDNCKGEIDPQHWTISTPRSGKNSDNTDHHSGTIHRENASDCTKEGGGDSVGHGDQKVGTFVTSYNIQDNWELHPTYGWVERTG